MEHVNVENRYSVLQENPTEDVDIDLNNPLQGNPADVDIDLNVPLQENAPDDEDIDLNAPLQDANEVSTNPLLLGDDNGGHEVPTNNSITDISQVTRPKKKAANCGDCIDVCFAVLFYVVLFAVVAVAATDGHQAVNGSSSSNNNTNAHNYKGYIWTVVICSIFSFFLSGVGLALLFKFPSICIKIALILSVILMGPCTVFAFMVGSGFIGIVGILFVIMSVYYTRMLWSRLPFVTVNLVTAITAIKDNYSLVFVAYYFAFVEAAFTFIWAVGFMGVWDRRTEFCEDNDCHIVDWLKLFWILPWAPSFFFLTYLFAHQVFQGCVHVIVADIVATWWYEPQKEGTGFYSPAVRDSFFRTISASFGTISYGSFLLSFLQPIKTVRNMHSCCDRGPALDERGKSWELCNLLFLVLFGLWFYLPFIFIPDFVPMCCVPCTYVYVGFYGYDYWEAGIKVKEPFQSRGWGATIDDELPTYTFLLISFVCGGTTGIIGIIITHLTATWVDDGDDDFFANTNTPVAFTFGFVVGLQLSSTVMSTLGGAVDTVLVLFAEAPEVFQLNYPELAPEMSEVWSRFYQ